MESDGVANRAAAVGAVTGRGRRPHARNYFPGVKANQTLTSDVRQQIEVFVIFILAAFSRAEQLFRLDELNPFDPLDHLVAKLVLDT